MATQAVNKANEESKGNELARKVTGSIEGTREFLHEVRVEMKQVTWPSRDDVVSTTGVVIATVAFFWRVSDDRGAAGTVGIGSLAELFPRLKGGTTYVDAVVHHPHVLGL